MQFEALFSALRTAGFDAWASELQAASSTWLVGHGDYARWSRVLTELPEIENAQGHFDSAAITVDGASRDPLQLQRALKGLMPWRKGPYQFADTLVDSEWRSDFKWQRLLPFLSSLQGRRVLDVGCGNGYHCWRMLDQAPDLVLGIEPSVLFNLQFYAVQKYLKRPEIHMLPIGIEAMPMEMNWFDSLFSMGVLYHRRSPIDHLLHLKNLLRVGGELCLETLVIDGGKGDVLVPPQRYARMNNVWFIPSAQELANWLQRCGFVDVRIVDVSVTSTEEQRTTDWMQFESLAQSLDPQNPLLTLEGLPAPRRAVLLATRA